MQDNTKSGKLPYLKQIITFIIVVWTVATLTSGFVLDTVIYVTELYARHIRQYGWYTFSAAVVVSVVTLTFILVREVRKDM